jgi:hypothetical protein
LKRPHRPEFTPLEQVREPAGDRVEQEADRLVDEDSRGGRISADA